MIKTDLMLYGSLGVAAVLLFMYVKKNAQNLAAAAAAGAVGMAGDTVAGVAQGLGSLAGVPSTSVSKCQQDMDNGDTWNASFDCPAGTFLGFLTGSQP
jgi:hypothetical protein